MTEKFSKKFNKYFIEDLKVGQKVIFSKFISQKDINNFAKLSGDNNPVHLDKKYAENTIFKTRVVHGFLTASLISAAIGTKLPGPGSIYLKQNLKFLAPVFPDNEVKVELKIKSVNMEKKTVCIETTCFVGEKEVLVGEAIILVESKKK